MNVSKFRVVDFIRTTFTKSFNFLCYVAFPLLAAFSSDKIAPKIYIDALPPLPSLYFMLFTSTLSVTIFVFSFTFVVIIAIGRYLV